MTNSFSIKYICRKDIIMSEVKVFDNEYFGNIRGVMVENKPYVVASDVAKALGYAKPNNAISTHCKCTLKQGIPHPQSKTKTIDVVLIPESDIYRLIFGSKLPEAERFQDWVFEEILPQLRQSGGVVVEGREEEFINNYFPSFSDDVKKAMTLDLYHKNQEYKRQLEVQKPKVDYYDNVMQSDHLLTTTQIGKDLGMSATKLNKLLVDNKVLYKQGKCYVPYAKYQFLIPKYADYKVTEHGQHLYWKEKGREWIINFLNDINTENN